MFAFNRSSLWHLPDDKDLQEEGWRNRVSADYFHIGLPKKHKFEVFASSTPLERKFKVEVPRAKLIRIGVCAWYFSPVSFLPYVSLIPRHQIKKKKCIVVPYKHHKHIIKPFAFNKKLLFLGPRGPLAAALPPLAPGALERRFLFSSLETLEVKLMKTI